MGWMAYDAIAVRRLEVAMRAALDELDSLRSALALDERAAADARRAVDRARSGLRDTWLPFLVPFNGCRVLDGYRPASVDIGDLSQVLTQAALRAGDGWLLSTDPLQDDAATVTFAEATALGERLAGDDLGALDDDADLAEIQAQLEVIGRDSILSAAFARAFDDWDGLADLLAGQRLTRQVHDDNDGVERIDGVAAALGTVLARATPPDVLASRAATMEPYTEALLFARSGLDADALARLADESLLRWRTDPLGADGYGRPDVAAMLGDNAADLWFRGLLATPGGCTAFVELAADHPIVLWSTATDQALAIDVAISGTDPARMSTSMAGYIVPSLIAWFPTGSDPTRDLLYLDVMRDDEQRAALGRLIAPWLINFSPQSTAWPQDATDKRDLLAMVLDDEAAFDELMTMGHDVATGIVTVDETQRLREISGMLTLLFQLGLRQRVADSESRIAAWSFLASIPAASLDPFPGVVAGAATTAVGSAGVFGPTPEHVRGDAAWDESWIRTLAASTVVSTAVAQMTSHGLMPPGATSPPEPDPDSDNPEHDYDEAYTRWERETFDDAHEAARAFIHERESIFVNASSAALDVAG